jgi:transcription-repair coupling factor (superfamily II helicase)
MKSPLFETIRDHIEWASLLRELNSNRVTNLRAPLGVIPFLLSVLSNTHTAIYAAVDEIQAEGVFETAKTLEKDRALFFPDIDVIPFTNIFPSADKLADRMSALFRMANTDKPLIVVTTIESLLRKLPPKAALEKSILNLKKGMTKDPAGLARTLAGLSYIREYKVTEPGCFSIRGDIIDIFPPHFKDAVRISLFGDEIESIRVFNPVTQKSIDEIPELSIIPASEFSLWKEKKIPDGEYDDTIMHSRFPEFYSRTDGIPAYSAFPSAVVLPDGWIHTGEEVFNKYTRYMPEEIPAEYLLHRFEDLNPDRIIELTGNPAAEAVTLNVRHPSVLEGGFTNFVRFLEESARDGERKKTFIFAEYEDLALRLEKILRRFDPKVVYTEDAIPDDKDTLIVVANIETGFELTAPDGEIWRVYSESDISGKKRLFRKRIRQIDSFFEGVEDIAEGEYVVHLNHGIGVFRGIRRINVLGKEKDYILIEYADNEKLFAPLEQAGMIGKYIGAGVTKPHLDSIGSKSWAKKRDAVQRSVEEFARKLIAIYAKRAELQGHRFGDDTSWQKEFEDQFEYIETPDQVRVLEEIKKDMESPKPMERLLCGDVGFGKTEVAMRAAFKSVMDGMQVALIAPTTVLVEQHYYTFTERFQGFPVKIASVSRFTPRKDVTRYRNELAEHKLDVIIGTHILFSESFKFHSLGLVIIDEEHKFGVEHKENLKERHPSVDFLSLSATPIPRTLNLALSSIRDISLLQTPPDMRIPIETQVADYAGEVVKFAIERELDRGGQVYFVHNSIKRLPEYAYSIEKMIPKAKVAIGHGQMEEEQLDEAFLGFVRGHYNVFVCTTIIESGLDIPNANTIIISDAQRYGLSQLYQLKGRVGRAKRQGYAYFLFPKDRVLTEEAQKRLYVINEYTDLGAGFQIAKKDLEIRGAGNILGREQHGNIAAVGYDSYIRMLREEIQRLKGEFKASTDTMIDLNYHAFIPDEYIAEPSLKMEVYKKVLSVRDEQDIRELSAEFADRFGRVPDEVATLFEISRMKIKACDMGIETLMEKGKWIEISFSKYSKVDPGKVLNLVATGKHPIKIDPVQKNKIFYERFESDISIKVRRLSAFLDDIRETQDEPLSGV